MPYCLALANCWIFFFGSCSSWSCHVGAGCEPVNAQKQVTISAIRVDFRNLDYLRFQSKLINLMLMENVNLF